ncbi:MAG: 3'-5' exonuclease [Deltaproteobacteria bacterium]|nr:3'-5' exonuclease [Deltaproteobacteria bacterium]
MPRLTKSHTFWWIVLSGTLFFIAVSLALAVILWMQLAMAEREFILGFIEVHSIYIFGATVILITGVGFAIDWVYWMYILPMHRIAEETGIIHGVNPGHRIRLKGSGDVVRLANAINTAADRYEELHRSVEERIAVSRVRIEEDKSILSVVLAELPEGVVICTAGGQITLYNQRAQQLLEAPHKLLSADGLHPAGGFIGLGRSVFSVVNKPIITHALKDIPEKLRSGHHDLTSSFVMIARNKRLLQAVTVPILSPLRELSGFVLILTDFTGQMESFRQVESLFESLSMGVRSAIASVRSSVEVILDYPDLPLSKRDEFQRIIHREALSAGAAMDRLTAEYAGSIRSPVPLPRMRLGDFLEAVRNKAEVKAGLSLSGEPAEDHLRISVDGYSMALATVFILQRVGAELGIRAFRWALDKKEHHLGLDFIWAGAPLRLEMLRQWEQQQITVADEGVNASLKEILARHRAELWSQTGGNTSEAYVRILLEAVEPAPVTYPRRQTILATARPVYYDFDLFNQPGQSPGLDDRLLTELVCTVFDTETTGLDIREGDEMVAIGAVRIVNGRLLESECFEQLVKTECIVRQESIRIHGIQPEMLEGQPDIEQVLKMFHRFSEGTILVAHNAAFDMRLLQLQEKRTGIRFDNPVLDTMLLSAVVHPAQRTHDLASIAERLGITVMGRHTALGDAIGTAEIYLKLIPLLAETGIHTLKQAREASRKTYHARVKY